MGCYTLLVYVFFIFLRILISDGSTYIRNDEVTWNEANKRCTMETPSVSFSGSKKDLPVDYDLTGTDVWVGYYLAATAFYYIGCMDVGNMTEKADFKHNTPGLCYSACTKNTWIGISKHKCYCLDDTVQSNVYNANCGEGCEDQDEVACGGDKSMSIYRIEATAGSYTDGDGECLLYETNSDGANSRWSKCEKTQNVICALSNGTIQNALDEHEDQQYKTWRDSMNTCLGLQRSPPSIEQLEGYISSTPSWTGVITSDVIYSINDAVNTYSTKRFGYLKKKNDEPTILKFGGKDKMKRILCKNGTSTSTSDNNSPTKPSTLSTDEITTVTGDTESRSTIGSTPRTSSRTFTLKASSNIGIPVGVSVASFLIVVTVVIAAVLLRRRGMCPTLCCRKQNPESSEKRTLDAILVNNKAYEIPSNSPYDQINEVTVPYTGTANNIPEDDGHYAHTYFVLENDARDSDTENNFEQSRADIDKDDAYNKLNSKVGYRNNSENAYDTTEKAAKRLKDQHNKEVVDGEISTAVVADEDDYNHINDTIMRKGKTDNVYGISQDIVNDYGDIASAYKKEQDSDNTYNHINMER